MRTVMMIGWMALATGCGIVSDDGRDGGGIAAGGDEVCAADACDCGGFDEGCDIDCSGTGACDVFCGDTPDCTVACGGAPDCDVQSGNSSVVDVSCEGASDCSVECSQADSCTVDCAGGDCEVTCPASGCLVTECGDDCTVTCGFLPAFPQGGTVECG